MIKRRKKFVPFGWSGAPKPGYRPECYRLRPEKRIPGGVLTEMLENGMARTKKVF